MTAAAQSHRHSRRAVLLPILIVVGMVSLVLAAGLVGYSYKLAEVRANRGRLLATITDLKVRQISAWLNERRSNADLILHDVRFAAQTEDWLISGAPDDAIGHSLESHIQSIQRTGQYHSVMLLDRDLIVRAVAGTTPAFDDILRRAARDALHKTSVTFVDNRADAARNPHGESFTMFVPLRVSDADAGIGTHTTRAVGLLALSIDPARYLYPLLDWWPTPARSGATYLVRYEGTLLTYMNGPSGTYSERLTVPLRLDKLIGPQALHSQTTLHEGLDYNQHPVLASIRRIPNTDWLLVAKLDMTEIAQSAQRAAIDIMLLTTALLTLIGSFTWYLWQLGRSRYQQAELQRLVLVRHLDYLSKYANDVILLTDDNGNILEANDKALEMYGYPREELLKMTLAGLRTAETLADYAAQWRQADLQHGLIYTTTHQHKNGGQFPVEISARYINVDGKRFRQAIIRDISERKQAEDELIRARDFYLSLLDIFPNPVWRASTDAMRNYFNQAWLDFTGRELAREHGNGWTSGVHPDDLDACMDTYLNACRDRRPFIMEYRLRYHDGSYHWLTDHGKPFFDQHGAFAGYIGSCYDIQQIKSAEERMEFLASHDSLTGLPNRVLLQDRIERALASARRESRQVAVLFIDLDRFKTINDELGHAGGDQVLRIFAVRLRKCVRDADTVSRLGGDEFVVVIPELREAADALPVAQKILDAMVDDVSIEGHSVRITPSIGISAYPHDGQEAQTLITNADAAMYNVKESGRNAIQFYSPALYISTHERINMEFGLRHALRHGKLELHYQPQIDVRTHRLVGLEALLRWHHPSKGLLLPAQFLPIAEMSSLSIAIGRWVLKTACAQCRAWRTGGMAVPVCINLSSVQFLHEDLVTDITAALHDNDLPAELLRISVTETMLQQPADAARETLRSLHALGIGVTIDDFNAGDPPLEQFRLHSIDIFMLNHKYVRNITRSSDAAAVTSAIIDMAHKQHLKVIAEGVETQDQLNLLNTQGCDAMQGFYFSEALPAARLADYLSNRAMLGATTSRH